MFHDDILGAMREGGRRAMTQSASQTATQRRCDLKVRAYLTSVDAERSLPPIACLTAAQLGTQADFAACAAERPAMRPKTAPAMRPAPPG